MIVIEAARLIMIVTKNRGIFNRFDKSEITIAITKRVSSNFFFVVYNFLGWCLNYVFFCLSQETIIYQLPKLDVNKYDVHILFSVTVVISSFILI